MTWQQRAACKGLPTATFFEDIWPGDGEYDTRAAHRARDICRSCPVRVPCFEASLAEEDGAADANRAGFRAGTTPSQRYSIWRRDSAQCIQCEETYDPLGIVRGDVVCECGSFKEPPIPPEGDTWYPRHDALLAKLTEHLLTKTAPGDRILPPYKMLLALGHRRKDDLPLVYEKLIADGLIVRGDSRGEYYRAAGREALASWRPPARRRRPPGPTTAAAS